jgi:hypothetical protein
MQFLKLQPFSPYKDDPLDYGEISDEPKTHQRYPSIGKEILSPSATILPKIEEYRPSKPVPYKS